MEQEEIFWFQGLNQLTKLWVVLQAYSKCTKNGLTMLIVNVQVHASKAKKLGIQGIKAISNACVYESNRIGNN
jgi:hypothetical protein